MTNAAAVIRDGGVIAYRTDTFYGLGADPFNATAVDKIRSLKRREDTKPILLLISSREEVDRFLLQRTAIFDEVAAMFWPGPITLIGEARPELPDELTAGSKTIGLRWPNDTRVCELIQRCGGALTATSANLSGSDPARTAEDVRQYFPEGLDLIVDDGPVTVEKPSTLLDLSSDQPKLIRAGMVSVEDLSKGLGRIY
jgi:L-threonylcarbamoyladenylate synthase